MENENVQEQELDETPDVSSEESTEESTDKDAQIAKYKAIAERKTKQLEKIKEAGSDEEEKPQDNKVKEEPNQISREEVIFFSKGGNEEDLELAKKIAKIDGVSILVAMEDDLYKSKVNERQAKNRATTLGASGGSKTGDGRIKSQGEMTREEHRESFNNRVNG